MIEILLDHSFEEEYFMISNIAVKVTDPSEKERIELLVKQLGLEGTLVFPDRDLSNRIAKLLQVDVSLIDFDTNEIDV